MDKALSLEPDKYFVLTEIFCFFFELNYFWLAFVDLNGFFFFFKKNSPKTSSTLAVQVNLHTTAHCRAGEIHSPPSMQEKQRSPLCSWWKSPASWWKSVSLAESQPVRTRILGGYLGGLGIPTCPFSVINAAPLHWTQIQSLSLIQGGSGTETRRKGFVCLFFKILTTTPFSLVGLIKNTISSGVYWFSKCMRLHHQLEKKKVWPKMFFLRKPLWEGVYSKY